MRLPVMNDIPECEVGYVGARQMPGPVWTRSLQAPSRQLHVATEHRDFRMFFLFFLTKIG